MSVQDAWLHKTDKGVTADCLQIEERQERNEHEINLPNESLGRLHIKCHGSVESSLLLMIRRRHGGRVGARTTLNSDNLFLHGDWQLMLDVVVVVVVVVNELLLGG